MKLYLFTATDRHGKRDTDGREAASIEHLRAKLEREGYRDIEFVDDEALAQLRAKRPQHLQPRTPAQIRFEADLRKGRKRGLILQQALRNNAAMLTAFALLLAYGVYRGDMRWVATALVGCAVLLGWILSRMKTGDTYDDLLKAQARGDLDRSDALIRRLRASREVQGKENILVDLTFRQAVLLARRGRLDEALALVAPLEGNPQLLKGMYESRTASIYYAGGRTDEFVRWMERAYDASEHAQAQTLDFAFTQARFGDIERARALLAQVEERNLRPIHAGVFKAAHGACLLRSGSYRQASELLAQAVDILKPFAASAPTWPFQGVIAGYAAIALSRNGERDAAQALIAPWTQVALSCLDPSARKLIETEVL